MSFDAGSIVSKLTLDKKSFDKSVQEVGAKQKTLGGFVQANSAKIKSMGRTMTVAGAAIVGAMGLMVTKYAQAGDEVHKMAIKTGFSTQALSELKYAAEISGGSLTSMEKGVKKMSKSLTDASIGLETYVRSFDRIGLSVEELMALSPEEQFMKIADGIASLESPTLRAATAQEIFGRAGTELLPLFAEGADGMAALRDKAKELGYSFDQEAATGAAKLVDAQTALKTAMSGLGISISQTLAPALTKLAEGLAETIGEITTWIKEHPKLTSIIAKAVLGLGALLTVMGPLMMMLPGIVTILPKIGLAVKALLGPWGLLATAVGLIAVKLIEAIGTFKKFKTSLEDYLDASGEKMSGFEKTWASLTATIHKHVYGVDVAKVAIKYYTEETKKLTKEQAEHAKKVLEVIKETKAYSTISGVITKLLGTEKKATEDLTDKIGSLGSAIKVTSEVIVNDFGRAGRDMADVLDWMNTSIPTTTIPAFRDLSGVLYNVQGSFKDLTIEERKFSEESKKVAEETAEMSEVLKAAFEGLAMSLGILGDEIGGPFGDVIGSIGIGIDSMAQSADKSFKGIVSAFLPVMGKIGGGIGEMISGAEENFSELGSAVGRSLGTVVGAITGLGPIAEAAGSFIGGIIGGLFGKAKTEAQRLAEQFAQTIEETKNVLSVFGEISDETAEKIAEDRKEMEGFAAVSKNFAAIIKDVGVTQENINDLWDRADDIIHQIADGSIEAEDGIMAVNDSFDLLLEGAQKFGTEGSAAMVNFINKVKASGLEISGVTDYINDQLGVVSGNSMSAAEGLAAMAAGVGNNEAAMGRLETQTLAVYNAMIANGATANQAMESLGGTLDAIATKHEEMGTEASVAIQALLGVREVTKEHTVLMDAIEGNNAVLTALGNTGSLNQEILDDSADSAKKYYKQLMRAGLDGDQALAQMAPTLENLAYLAEEHGYELDNNTQKLYDEAVAAGYVAEKQMSTNDIMMAGLGAIIEALGGDIPDAFRSAMDSMSDFGDSGEDAFSDIATAADSAMGDIEDDIFDAGKSFEAAFSDGIDGAIGDVRRLSGYIGRADFSAKFNLKTAGAFRGLPGYDKKEMATGFDGIIDQPTLALMGEAGPERVKVQPLSNQPSSQNANLGTGATMNNTVIINAQKLDDYTIQQAGEKLFREIDRQQNKRRGL